MLISGGAGYCAGKATDNGSNHCSLCVAHRGSDHCSSSGATADDGSRPAIVGVVIVVAVIVSRSPVNRCWRRINVGWTLSTTVADPTVIPSIIISEVGIPIAAPVTIILMRSRLILYSSTVLVAVIGCHGWHTGANKGGNCADRNKLLNVFHKCLRL
jgi:hypothetical protein